MKQTLYQDDPHNAGLKLTPVRFEYADPTAKTVCLAGSFNHWRPEARQLQSSGAGNWWEDTVLAPGTYEYCFVVDVGNPFGGRNSVLHVAVSTEAAHLADAQNVPFLQETNQPTVIG